MTENKVEEIMKTYDQMTHERLMSLLEYKDLQIKTLMKYNKANNDWGMTLFVALENLYNDYASYYPSAVDNSPAMKAAAELLKDDEEESDGE